MGSSLNKENSIPVGAYVLFVVALYAVFLSGAEGSWGALGKAFRDLKADTLTAAMLPVICLLVRGLVSSGQKDKLVFWRCRYALPGHRAFSKLAKKDSRIDMKRLSSKIGRLPAEAKEQNATWYRLYRQHQDKTLVRETHKHFLLARDLAVIALLFVAFGAMGLFVAGAGSGPITGYAGLMLAQYFGFAVVAKNHGTRLVCNVLVEAMRI